MSGQPYFRSAVACRIVSLDRVKFNDAVASGTYPCAPSTTGGSARLFTEEDLLPLFFFARLTEFGLPAGKAGSMACEIASRVATSKKRSNHITLSYGVSTNVWAMGEKRHAGLGRLIFTVVFHIADVRRIIADGINAEAKKA